MLLFFLAATAISAFGQDQEADSLHYSRGREKIRAAHAAYITERLQLTASEAEKFWPLYREFGQKRRELRGRLREAKRAGADEQSLLDLDMKIRQQQLDLEKEYFQRFESIISAEKVLKLRQAEVDFRKLVLQHLQQRQHRRR